MNRVSKKCIRSPERPENPPNTFSLLFGGYRGGLSLWKKRPGCAAKHSTRSNAGISNAYYYSASPHALMPWCVITHKYTSIPEKTC